MEVLRHWVSPDGRRAETLVRHPDLDIVLVRWHNVVWPYERMTLDEANRWCTDRGLPPIGE
jgi:hypothetical protein